MDERGDDRGSEVGVGRPGFILKRPWIAIDRASRGCRSVAVVMSCGQILVQGHGNRHKSSNGDQRRDDSLNDAKPSYPPLQSLGSDQWDVARLFKEYSHLVTSCNLLMFIIPPEFMLVLRSKLQWLHRAGTSLAQVAWM